MKVHHVLNRISIIVLIFAAGYPLSAASSQLPTGREVIEAWIQAGGGRKELLKIENSVTRGTLDIKTLGLEGTFTIYMARPNKIRARFDIEGFGVIERGFDGNVYWDRRTSTGPRILKGTERRINVALAYFDAVYYDQIFKEIRCEGTEEVQGQPCYKIALVPEGCDPITVYYAQETGLPLKEELVVQRLYRRDRVVNTIKGYKKINGLHIPHLNIEHVAGTVTHRQTESIEFNATLPEGIFTLPEDVRALLDEEKALDASPSSDVFVD